MNIKFNQEKSEKQLRFHRILKWILSIILVWGIPSAIFWTGIKLHTNDRQVQYASQTHTQQNYQLDNFIYKSSPTSFYLPGFKNLFRQLKGLPANLESLKKIIEEYKATWPKGLIDIYLFNGENKIFPIANARAEYEVLFRLINSEFETSTGISAEEIARVGQVSPSPDLSLNYTREQSGKIVELGNPDRFSYCFFERDKSIYKNFVAGILIFVHEEAINTAQKLKRSIPKSFQQNYGFVNALGDSQLPETLSDLPPEELLDYAQQYPLNSFTLKNHHITLKRYDEYTLLVAAQPASSLTGIYFWLIVLAYIIASIYFISFAYKIVVKQKRFQHNIRHRLIGLFGLCYALPLIAALFLAFQYLAEFKHSLTSEIKHDNYRRLAEIDSGFSRFLTSKLMFLRKFSQEIQKQAENKNEIKKKLKDLYDQFEADSVHMIASDSQIVFTTDLLTAEIRRHYDKTRQQRQKILESWKARQAKLTDKHIKVLFGEPGKDGKPVKPELSEGHLGFIRVFKSTALSAMDFFNRSKNITLPIRKSSSDLVIDTIIESNTQSLFQSARTNISRFTSIQGMNEIFKAYLDIIAGPQKESWYAFVVLIDLVNYERQYFEQLYSDLRSRSEIMNKVFPEEDIRAISTHQFAANFPSVMEFKNFEAIIQRSVNDFKTFTQRMNLEGRNCLVSVLKASYLKHYLLVKIVPVSKIESIFSKRLKLIGIFLFAIILVGIILSRLLTHLFIQPINEIMTGVKALASRDYDHRIPVRNENEFGILARSFNESAATLKRMALSEKIRKNLYPETEFRCGSYLISTANSNSRIILSDFFDYFPLKQGVYSIILAEVSGNDISAAYLTAMLKTSFTLLCPSFPDSPELILQKLNQIFVPYYNKGHLTTCFIGLLDPTNEKMVCANAGQSYPVVIGVKSSEERSFVSLPSTPLGIDKNATFTKHEISLHQKALILYSDGAVNLVNSQGIKLGHERLLEIVEKAIKKDPRNPSDAILKSLSQESMNVPWRDDITIMTIQNRI